MSYHEYERLLLDHPCATMNLKAKRDPQCLVYALAPFVGSGSPDNQIHGHVPELVLSEIRDDCLRFSEVLKLLSERFSGPVLPRLELYSSQSMRSSGLRLPPVWSRIFFMLYPGCYHSDRVIIVMEYRGEARPRERGNRFLQDGVARSRGCWAEVSVTSVGSDYMRYC